jgi:hypothetical protein
MFGRPFLLHQSDPSCAVTSVTSDFAKSRNLLLLFFGLNQTLPKVKQTLVLAIYTYVRRTQDLAY